MGNRVDLANTLCCCQKERFSNSEANSIEGQYQDTERSEQTTVIQGLNTTKGGIAPAFCAYITLRI